MDAALDLTGYAHALGCAQAAWRFASVELRRASALAAVAAAWDTFRRDAGPGNVGPAHETTPAAMQLLLTEDPRRDFVLLWLADHGASAIAEAAATVARMVAATRRFGPDEQALLESARDALAHGSTSSGPIARMFVGAHGLNDPVIGPLRAAAAAVERLRRDTGFVEGEGTEVFHTLPGGTLRRYVVAEPAACWALNLALLSKGAQPGGAMPAPGLVSRVLFRNDLEVEEIAHQLVEDATSAWSAHYDDLVRLEPELARGGAALTQFSRNARTRDAWLLVAALSACTRTQLKHGLGLSRAGADIQVHALADAGLVDLEPGGRVAWARTRQDDDRPQPLDQGPLGGAVSALDASLAAIDQLLARTARQRSSLDAIGRSAEAAAPSSLTRE